ncbi:hypothetical protein BI375_23205 [Vibrio rotiferianus]|uniref:TIR domain-containing protein n=1 Tax=Vibrio rotiferianus TaxID=190895 RepID=A0ABX3D565_9VIBR|nr:toll/interleukin-1 receptor domain-containing protein [Vibrio rotiferianus]OHY90373.1 hypothetical protein BI375_23205 [Vibrio rotiferianus]
MSDISKNAIAYLQKKFSAGAVLNNANSFNDVDGNELLKFWPMIGQNFKSGVKQRAIAIGNVDNEDYLSLIAQDLDSIFSELDSSLYVKVSNDQKPTGHEIDTVQMTFAPRVLIYTSKLCIPVANVINIFNSVSTLVEIVDESEMHKTLFISYGGPDEDCVIEINKKIKSKGVKTWFFPEDSLPGDKLHRMMHEGVNSHDRVLLVCSENSLTRPGVLNEIERVLEREAKEGGSEILIPITLDDYVYGEWAPQRSDIADQIRSRVITKFTSDNEDESIEKLVKVLVN